MISLGSDILSISRLTRVWLRFPRAFEHKILSASEQEIYKTISSDTSKLQFLAGRFCAKEAVFKALCPQEILTWKRISILSYDSIKKPKVFIDGKHRTDVSLSISHEEEYAMAVSVVER